MSTTPTLPPLTGPATWWRRLCWVADGRIAISGDLPVDPSRARAQLRDWREAGITHVVDLREEWTDEAVVATHAPESAVLWRHTRGDLPAADAIDAVTAVRAWHHDNPCDVGWIISRIRRAEDDE